MPPSPIGITTTIPVEIAHAAGRQVRDLNNLLVQDPEPAALVARAERAGFPAAMCAWIKGIYGVVQKYGVGEVIGVVEGDCAETGVLLEILASEGVEVHPFGYPHDRDRRRLTDAMTRLASSLGTTLAAAAASKEKLDHVRRLALRLQELADQGRLTSRGLFTSLIGLTDFAPDPETCAQRLAAAVEAAGGEAIGGEHLRLGYLGVPPIFSDFWEVFEKLGARFVYLEVPRQFAMLHGIDRDLLDTCLAYTYPYGATARAPEIAHAVEAYRLRGLVHYTQSFCHRRLHDRLLRLELEIPILTLEADRPGPVDARSITRIEAFLESLRATA